jgi:hypothetical protein
MISFSYLPLRQWVGNSSTDFLIDRKDWDNMEIQKNANMPNLLEAFFNPLQIF